MKILKHHFVWPLFLPAYLFAQQAQWELVRENFYGEIAVDHTDPNIVYVYSWYSAAGRGLHKSINGGETWVNYQQGYEGLGGGGVIAGLGTGGILIDPTNPQRLWVYGGAFKGIVRSEDGGMTAVRADTGISFSSHGYAVTALAYDYVRDILYAAEISGFGGVFRSLDGGRSWRMLNRIGFTLPFEPYCFVVDIETGWLFSGSNRPGVFRSKDSGETWEAIGAEIVGDRPIWLIAQVPGSHTLYAAGRFGGIFKSYDLGEDWISASTALTDSGQFEGGLVISSLDTNYVFVASKDDSQLDQLGGVYWSSDGGNRWQIIYLGLPEAERFRWDVFSLAQSCVSHDLYMAYTYSTSKAIYRLPQELLTYVGGDQSYGQPSDFALQQNYPNPFNSRTRIEFSLKKAESIRLDVYDIAGEHVVNLLASRMQPGHHAVDWDGKTQKGGDVTSGIYIYRLVTANESHVRKLLLIR